MSTQHAKQAASTITTALQPATAALVSLYDGASEVQAVNSTIVVTFDDGSKLIYVPAQVIVA